MGFEDLADVHSRRHTQRVQHHIDRRTVFEERHVFGWQDARNHTLVTVTAGHLVARLQLALNRHEDLDHLEHARSEFIAPFQLFLTVVELVFDDLDGIVILRLDGFDLGLASSSATANLNHSIFSIVEQLGVDHYHPS